MTQINVDQVFSCNEQTKEITVDRSKLRPWLVDWKIGSMLNSPYAGNGRNCGDYGWTAPQWRKAIQLIQVPRHSSIYTASPLPHRCPYRRKPLPLGCRQFCSD